MTTSRWTEEAEISSCQNLHLWHHNIQQGKILPDRCFSQRRKGLVPHPTLGTPDPGICKRVMSPQNIWVAKPTGLKSKVLQETEILIFEDSCAVSFPKRPNEKVTVGKAICDYMWGKFFADWGHQLKGEAVDMIPGDGDAGTHHCCTLHTASGQLF